MILFGVQTFLWGAETLNAVNHLAKQPLPVDVYYNEEDSYAIN